MKIYSPAIVLRNIGRLLAILILCGTVVQAQEQQAPDEGLHLITQAGVADQTSLNEVDFSPDGRYFISPGNTIGIWNYPSCKLVKRLQGATSGKNAGMSSARFSPDGKYILGGGNDGKAILWEMETGKIIQTFQVAGQGRAGQGVADVAFSSDGRLIATVCCPSLDQGLAQLWDVTTGKEIRRFTDNANGLIQVRFLSDKSLVTAGKLGEIRKWDIGSGRELLHVRTQGRIESLQVSRNDRYALIVNGSWVAGDKLDEYSRYASLVDLTNGEIVSSFKFNKGPYTLYAPVPYLSSDGKSVILPPAYQAQPPTREIYKQTQLVYWNIALRTAEKTVTVPGVMGTGFAECRNTVLLFDYEGFWDLEQQKKTATMGSNKTFFGGTGPALLNQDRLLHVGNKAWELSTGLEVTDFYSRFFEGNIMSKLSPSGKLLCHYEEKPKAEDETKPKRKNEIIISDTKSPAQRIVMQGLFAFYCLGQTTQSFASNFSKQLTFSGDERYLVVQGQRPEFGIRVWDVTTGQQIATLEPPPGGFDASTFGRSEQKKACSHDNKYFIVAEENGYVHGWEIATGKIAWSSKVGISTQGLAMANRSNFFLLYYGAEREHDGRKWIEWCTAMFDTTTGKEIRRLKLRPYLTPFAWFVSPDDRSVLIENPALVLWSLDEERAVQQFPATVSQLFTRHQVAFSNDGRLLVTYGGDGLLRFWEMDTGKLLCSLAGFSDGTWAAIDSEGRYDASNGGDVEGLHWVKGITPISLDQFKDGFYEPGLLAKKLGYNKEPLRTVPKLADVKLFPEIALTPPQDNKATLELAAKDGGIGPVQVWINGKEWIEDARPKEFDPKTATAKITLNLDSPLIKSGEENTLRVVARNAAATLASPPVEVKWQAAGAPEKFEPRLYAIVCGISQYANPDKIRNLRFADKDARDMAAALAIGAQKLFGTEKIEIRLFTGEGRNKRNANRQPASTATKANLQAAFEAVAKIARPQDVLVVYLAGHGTTLGLGSSVYCYPTQEADGTDFAAAAMAGKMITSDELAQWTKAIPAQKQVLILDTCASGAAGASLTEKRAVSGDQVRAIEKLKDRVGYHVLMGSAADAKSYEATRFNQGLLTYALLEGMKGPAREESKELLEVENWFAYARQQVPKLAGAVGGIQEPQIAVPTQKGKAQNFPVAQLDAVTSREVPLSPGGILVVTPRIVDGEGEDALGLQTAMVKALEEATLGELNVGGQAIAGLTYVPTDELPGAWRMGGSYQVEGDRVTLQVTLRGEKESGGETEVKRTLTGRRTELAELAGQGVALLRNAALGIVPTEMPPVVATPAKPAVAVPGGKASRLPKQRWSGRQGRELSAAVDYFAGSALPAAGQLQLAGEVTDVDSVQRQMTLSVHAFRLPNGKFQVLPAPKPKTVRLPENNGQEWQPGDEVVVTVPDTNGAQQTAVNIE